MKLLVLHTGSPHGNLNQSLSLSRSPSRHHLRGSACNPETAAKNFAAAKRGRTADLCLSSNLQIFMESARLSLAAQAEQMHNSLRGQTAGSSEISCIRLITHTCTLKRSHVCEHTRLTRSQSAVIIALSTRGETLTLLFWPDQWTMAWLWDESPVRANVELFTFGSSCLAPALLRSSPLQRSSARSTLRTVSASWWSAAESPAKSPPLLLLARAPKLAETLLWAKSSVLRSAGRLPVLRLSRGSTFGAHSANPSSQGSPCVPKSSPCAPVPDSPVFSFISSSRARHLCPRWHDLQVISAVAAWKRHGVKSSRHQSARGHFGLKPAYRCISVGSKVCEARSPFPDSALSLPVPAAGAAQTKVRPNLKGLMKWSLARTREELSIQMCRRTMLRLSFPLVVIFYLH